MERVDGLTTQIWVPCGVARRDARMVEAGDGRKHGRVHLVSVTIVSVTALALARGWLEAISLLEMERVRCPDAGGGLPLDAIARDGAGGGSSFPSVPI